jgi:organic radical activating enzyme
MIKQEDQHMNRLKLWSVTWETTTAGPSPFDNNRTEIFLFGCEKAKVGNPCKGCFNSKLWDNSIAERDYTPEEIAIQVINNAPNKYVTIGGGEPTDQMEGLIELCERLKLAGFHIMVYTWKSMKHIYEGIYQQDLQTTMRVAEMQKQFRKLLSNIDMLVDGQFILEQRLYQEEWTDGLFNSVGSGNQIVWDVRTFNQSSSKFIEGYAMCDLDALHIKDNGNLVYIVKDIRKPAETVLIYQ